MNEYACYDSKLAVKTLASTAANACLLDHAQEKNISQTNKDRTSTSNNILKFCRQRRSCLIMSVSYSVLIQYLTCPSLM
uniref:Uncharacterized protein n=1 Tax=Glossina palpalis gambiensis TaxID=67801 RepID=A0A1B0BQX4_9MUSC